MIIIDYNTVTVFHMYSEVFKVEILKH